MSNNHLIFLINSFNICVRDIIFRKFKTAKEFGIRKTLRYIMNNFKEILHNFKLEIKVKLLKKRIYLVLGDIKKLTFISKLNFKIKHL